MVVCDLGIDKLVVYRFDAARGTIERHGDVELPVGSGPRHFLFHPSRPLAYAVCELSSQLVSLAYDAESGTFAVIGSQATTESWAKGDNYCSALKLAPNGQWLYVGNIGWVSGFLLLEDRDDGPLLAVEVTPVGRAGFLAYRLAVSAGITALITAMGVALLLPGEAIWLKLLLLTAIPAETVLACVALLALARNKVEGLALTKLTNILAVVPLLAIVPSPWRYVAGVLPTYWIGELIFHLSALPSWSIVAALAVTHAIALAVLLRLFSDRTR